jgi:hypothetical protein
VSRKLTAIGEVGYLAKYGKYKERKVVNHVFPISGFGIFTLGSALQTLHHQQ